MTTNNFLETSPASTTLSLPAARSAGFGVFPCCSGHQVRDNLTTHTHTRISRARPAKAPPRSWYPGRVEHQCGTETAPAQSEAAEGLLTGRGGSRPGSAEDAAEQPEPQRCPAAGSPSPGHPSPPGSRYSKGSLQRGAVRPSVSRRAMGRPRAPRKKPRPSCVLLLLRSPGPGSSPEQQGDRSLPFPSARVVSPLALRTNVRGKEFKPRRKKKKKRRRGGEREAGGGTEEGTPTPPSPSQGKKKKNHQGTRRKIRRTEDAGDGGSARAGTAAVLMLPLRASAPQPAAGQRDSEGFPGARQLTWRDCVCAHGARSPAATGGRTHGLSAARRGAASQKQNKLLTL